MKFFVSGEVEKARQTSLEEITKIKEDIQSTLHESIANMAG